MPTRRHSSVFAIAAWLLNLLPPAAGAEPVHIEGPPGSGAFGSQVIRLPNGNFVVTDPKFSLGALESVGAVYLYSPEGKLLSALTGSQQDDEVSALGGVVVLANGDFVVCSPSWNNGGAADAGAVTQLDGDGGFFGTVSAANSLVGSNTADYVGNQCVTPLANGHYVVGSSSWRNGSARLAGASTWVNSAIGLTGPVSASNSLVGTRLGDRIGMVRELRNGNYVVTSKYWDDDGVSDAGSATWVDGDIGITGVVSAANSLVGSSHSDEVGGWENVYPLANGDYVVASNLRIDGSVNDGAVTWADGDSGIVGRVSIANSLVGTGINNFAGQQNIVELANGNYLVRSTSWTNNGAEYAGALTWCRAGTPLAGAISPANSLVGGSSVDNIGMYVLPLPNGNYVTASDAWRNGTAYGAGAVTWADGSTGISGIVSADNSLVGTRNDDRVGNVTLLRNGNYVVASPRWDDGDIVDAGAVTWIDGDTGLHGKVGSNNSLVGSSIGDRVGTSVTALANGHYVVGSPRWVHGTIPNAGAATWADGNAGRIGRVTPQNSLVGLRNDQIGARVQSLTNGNYVVISALWDRDKIADVGAVTWGDGNGGLTGTVSATNSLVGERFDDRIGANGVTELDNGHYLVSSVSWSISPGLPTAIVTWGNGTRGIRGVVSADNSLLGTSTHSFIGPLVTTLSNGHYVVGIPNWRNGVVDNAGAAAWGDGDTGIVGTVTPANALVGSSETDLVGSRMDPIFAILPGAIALADGNYAVLSPRWSSGNVADAGAATLLHGDGSSSGTIDALNSVIGTVADGGTEMNYAYDSGRKMLIVGQPAGNRVSLLTLPPRDLFANGFE